MISLSDGKCGREAQWRPGYRFSRLPIKL